MAYQLVNPWYTIGLPLVYYWLTIGRDMMKLYTAVHSLYNCTLYTDWCKVYTTVHSTFFLP